MRIATRVTGDIRAIYEAEFRKAEKAVTLALRSATADLKAGWRAQVAGAGLGEKLSNAVRGEAWPKGTDSIGAAGMVWTKAPKIIGAHQAGPLIRSVNGFWLAIPTAAAPKGLRGARITPDEWERRTGRRLKFVYRSGRSALLVDEGQRAYRKRSDPVGFGQTGTERRRNYSVVIFTLVPQVKLPKRLDLLGAFEAVSDTIARRIVAAWPE